MKKKTDGEQAILLLEEMTMVVNPWTENYDEDDSNDCWYCQFCYATSDTQGLGSTHKENCVYMESKKFLKELKK